MPFRTRDFAFLGAMAEKLDIWYGQAPGARRRSTRKFVAETLGAQPGRLAPEGGP